MKTYYIREITSAIAKNGNRYSTFFLVDTAGKELKCYLYAEEDYSAFAGHVIVGSIDTSVQFPKLQPDDLQTAYPVEKHPTPEFDHFKSHVPTVEQFVATVHSLLDKCVQADGQHLSQQQRDVILADVENVACAYASAYAAKSIHHSYAGGLLEHTYEMLRLLCVFVGNPGYCPVPFNTLRALLGIVYHDYGKLADYGANGEYTEDLCLTPHVYSSARYFVHTYESVLQPKDLQMIEHIILSHHGRIEWGAAILPATGTAYLVHTLDLMSARGNAMRRATNLSRVGDITFVRE